MAEAAFDMMAEVQRLRDAGFAQEQAEAVTRSIHAGVTGGVATRADLAEIKTAISDMKYDLTWRVFGLFLAGLVLSNTISFFLIRAMIERSLIGQ